MKQIIIFVITFIFVYTNAQTRATRFFYDLTYKTDSLKNIKILTVLDVTDQKSIYRDYLVVSQDSIIQQQIDQSRKSGIRVDMNQIIQLPKFTYKVIKPYPIKEIIFSNKILQDEINYHEMPKLDWKIKAEKKKIDSYETQKATVLYGGREWTAWFAPEIPFQDGPYKFNGLPGLIVQIADKENLYSWKLSGVKKITNFNEYSFLDSKPKSNDLSNVSVSKEKFIKVYDDYKANPLGSLKGKLSKEQLENKMPDGRTVAEAFKGEEYKIIKLLNDKVNNIELKP
ncbi:GLPGLI family protein [Chryseobacterium sp. GMJ5]|uniref:GLPGLI family protein n=1 Tax=Chryseobacterium gilvum TaxID=2976534 RepID=A0ABT2VVA5_9FLAO|nr:GLPGLI family protein [Chryseobacterium gilvum]MCU7613929.1 GLPGLI family protein [Chryseobacterium gilvum]